LPSPNPPSLPPSPPRVASAPFRLLAFRRPSLRPPAGDPAVQLAWVRAFQEASVRPLRRMAFSARHAESHAAFLRASETSAWPTWPACWAAPPFSRRCPRLAEVPALVPSLAPLSRRDGPQRRRRPPYRTAPLAAPAPASVAAAGLLESLLRRAKLPCQQRSCHFHWRDLAGSHVEAWWRPRPATRRRWWAWT